VKAHRAEVRLVAFGEPVGREQAGVRPAVVVSADALNEGPSGVLLVVPITSARRDLPSHTEIDDPGASLDGISYAKYEDLKSVLGHRLVNRPGAVEPTVTAAIERVALADPTVMVAADSGGGGTWSGAEEALRKGYGCVAVWRGAGEGPGNAALGRMGATPVHLLGELEALLQEPEPRPAPQQLTML